MEVLDVPDVSVIVVIGRQRSRAQECLHAIAAQGADEADEVVVIDVVPDVPPLACGVSRLVYRSLPGTPWSVARVAGARLARGRAVAFVEEHVVVQEGWLSALKRAAQKGESEAWGYAFVPGPPHNWFGRSSFFSDYAEWARPVRGGRPNRSLASNNIAYSRKALEALEPLEMNLAFDFAAVERLGRLKVRTELLGDAVVAHEGYAEWRPLLAANYGYARALAAARADVGGWSRGRRIAYTIGAPLGAPVIRLIRLLAGLRGRPGLPTEVARALPVLLPVYLAASFGEAIGFLGGAGSLAALTEAEIHHDRSRIGDAA